MLQAEVVVSMVTEQLARIITCEYFMQSSSDPVVCLCCRGDHLYSGHSGGQVRLWSISSSSMLKYVPDYCICAYFALKSMIRIF